MTDIRELVIATGQGNPSDLFCLYPFFGLERGSATVALTGLAYDPTTGILYGVTGFGSPVDPRSIGTVDPDDGTWTLIGPLGLPSSPTCSDITFDASGQMWGVRASSGGGFAQLVQIDKATGAGTFIGSPPVYRGGAVEYANGVLYYFDQNGNSGDLCSIDPVTGVFSVIVGMSGDQFTINAAAYNPGTQVMYVSDTNTISVVDLVTGVTEYVFPDMSSIASGFDAAVWDLGEDIDTTTRFAGSPPWRFFITNMDPADVADRQTIGLLDQKATNKALVYALNQPAIHSGQLPSDSTEVNRPFPDADDEPNVHPNLRMIFGLRRETGAADLLGVKWVCRFAGILMSIEDQGTDAPTSTYTAYDPWQWLFSRPCLDENYNLPPERGLLFWNQRGDQIARTLIQRTIDLNGTVYLDINNGTIENTAIVPGPDEYFVIERGVSVGEALQRLCNTGTMDIVITPNYSPIFTPQIIGYLNIYDFAGDRQDDAVMAWDKGPRSITSISRMLDGTQLANKVQMFAGQGGDPVTLEVDSASVTKYGEYYAQQFLSSQLGKETFVQLYGEALALIRKDGNRSVSFDPAPERSPLVLRDYGLGDYLPVWASRNLRQPIAPDYDMAPYDAGAAGYLRVYAIPIEIDDAGVERVRGILTSQDAPS